MSDTLFVTVGTTKFDKLIRAVTYEKTLSLLKQNGFNNLILQIGNTVLTPRKSDIINIEYYNLKPSIEEDIQKSRLVISHSGAGSCLEVLSFNKPLIAVVNDDLMDNHQLELARKLADEDYIFYTSVYTLYDTLIQAFKNIDTLKPYPKGNPKLFADYVDKVVGF